MIPIRAVIIRTSYTVRRPLLANILFLTGVTPLHESLVYGSKEQVRTLLQSGASVGKLSGEDKMFKIFRLLQNVVDSVVSKASMDLAENSDTEGMLEVLRDERKEYIMQNKESQVQTETASEVDQETEVVQETDKPVNAGKTNDNEMRVLICPFFNGNILFSDQS